MERRNENIYLKILVNILIYIAGLLFLFFIVPDLFGFFLPFIIAWVIAWIANPLVHFLENRLKIVRKFGSMLIIFLVIAIVAIALYGIGRFLIGQIMVLVNEMPNIVLTLSNTLDQVVENLSSTLSGWSPTINESIYEIGSNLRDNFNTFITGARVPEATIGFTRNIGDYLLFIITMFISAYFFIKDRETIITKTRELTPKSVLEKLELITNQFNYAVTGYVKAQFKIMAVVVVILYIGFKIISTPYALLIALLTGFIDILPIFGTGFILWPWAVIALILGNYSQAIMLIGLYLVCQLIKNILQPKLVGDSVGLNPLTTLILMYIGYQIVGFLGLILAIPTGLILINLYRAGMFNNIIRGFSILVTDLNRYRKF